MRDLLSNALLKPGAVFIIFPDLSAQESLRRANGIPLVYAVSGKPRLAPGDLPSPFVFTIYQSNTTD